VRGEGANPLEFIRWLAVAALAGWLAVAHAQQPKLEVITLKYRNAEQVIPMLKPLLAPGGTISGLQNRLVIRTTPENLAELRQVLDTVDAAPRRLMISVRQDVAGAGSRDEAELSGSIGTDNARVTVPGSGRKEGGNVTIRRGEDRASARVLSSRSAANDRSVQTLQVLEGGEAWIQVGQSVPVEGGGVTISPLGASITQSTQYRDVGSGFRVKPRVSGDRVTLEISTRRDAVGSDTRNFDVQRVDTIVSGRLGEWMELGGVAQESTRSDRGTVSRSTSMGTENRSVYLKVDELR
jgi:type II secretory pathway component GspD/PulD (secretin)